MYSITDIENKLRIKLRDLTDAKWTDPEKQEAIVEALHDPAFTDIIEDETLVVSAEQAEYTIPDVIDQVSRVYFDLSNTKTMIPGDQWEQVNRTIRFRMLPAFSQLYTGLMPDGATLYLVGFAANPTTIPEEKSNLCMYLASVYLYEMLMNKYASGLLMSDITLAEIMTALNYWEKKVEVERGRYRRATNSLGYRV